MKKVAGRRGIRPALFILPITAFLSACGVTPQPVTGNLWEYNLSDALLSYLALVPGTEEIVATGFFGTVAVVSRDGAALWSTKYSEKEESFLMPPVVAPEGDVFLLSESGHVFRLRKDGAAWAQQWENKEYTRDISTPLMVQDQFVYAYYENYGLLVQLSRDTGQKLRELQLPPLSYYAGGSTEDGSISDRIIRPGDTRLFVFTTVTPKGGTDPEVRLQVLDTGLAAVSESVLGTYGYDDEVPTAFPSTREHIRPMQYPVVEGDSAYVWFTRTTAYSASLMEIVYVKYRIDANGALTNAGEVRPSVATLQAMTGWFTVEEGFLDASGRILTQMMGYNSENGGLYFQHAIVETGVVTSELTLDLGLPAGWEVVAYVASSRQDGVWDARGDYYFSCSVGQNNTPSETRIYRLQTAGIAAGTTTAAPALVCSLPAPSTHTNLLVLSDGRLVAGTKDGRIYCFQTDSPGVDPGALRPVYYQAQSNRGRK